MGGRDQSQVKIKFKKFKKIKSIPIYVPKSHNDDRDGPLFGLGGSCLDRGHCFDQRANHLFRGKGNSAVDDV